MLHGEVMMGRGVWREREREEEGVNDVGEGEGRGEERGGGH